MPLWPTPRPWEIRAQSRLSAGPSTRPWSGIWRKGTLIYNHKQIGNSIEKLKSALVAVVHPGLCLCEFRTLRVVFEKCDRKMIWIFRHSVISAKSLNLNEAIVKKETRFMSHLGKKRRQHFFIMLPEKSPFQQCIIGKLLGRSGSERLNFIIISGIIGIK